MCGIYAYTGRREAEPILVAGLGRLEYRGYDSAGLATSTGSTLHLRKRAGRVAALAALLAEAPAPGCLGIAHTRWATHGGATDVNAHPHLGGRGDVAVVHNGVIDNYLDLKRELQAAGTVFRSTTDSEVIAHLIAHYLEDDLVEAVRRALARLRGSYALAVISRHHPGQVVGARLASPLALGIGSDEVFLASDPAAFVGCARQAIYLADHQLCVATPRHWEVLDAQRTPVAPRVYPLSGEPGDTEKGAFAHHMLKEIYEQPQALRRALHGRLGRTASDFLGTCNLDGQIFRQGQRIIMTGCGTSYHAALVGKYLFEELARVPVDVEYASELRYRDAPLEPGQLVLAITQSGETADTLAALRECRRRGCRTLALCNVPGSSITREADGVIFLQAGPELGVASTKAFTAQVAVLTALAMNAARGRPGCDEAHISRLTQTLEQLPETLRRTLEYQDSVRRIAAKYAQVRNLLFLGRKYLYPTALEGALKLKEISYIHAEGYPAAEMKHGPIALVDRDTPSLFLVSPGPVYAKLMSNLEEIKARGGPVIAVTTVGDRTTAQRADDVLYVPLVPEPVQPLVSVVPLQLLAYHMALLRGCDADRPRHLAKSVTVE